MRRDDLPDRELLDLLERQLARHQAVISRLANNSVQVKTWCVTALAALVALATNNREPELVLVGVMLLAAFFVLDSYYLVLERHFRRESARLVDDVAADSLDDWRALLRVEGPGLSGAQWRPIASCWKSLAVSPFYVGLGALLLVGLVLAT